MMHKLWAVALALLLISAGAGWWYTKPPSISALNKRSAAMRSAALVDESSYATAQKLAQLATTPEEQPHAQSALRIADHQLDLAFTSALRDVEAHPPTLSPEALNIQDRLKKSQALLDTDQQRVTQLTAAVAAASASQKDMLQDELDLAQAQLDLDKDELEEANQDLLAAGGNPQQRIEMLVHEHDAQAKARSATAAGATPAATGSGAEHHGSFQELREWLKFRQKLQLLADAQDDARQKAQSLSAQRVALADSLENTKGGIAELAHHTKSAKAAGTPAGAAPHAQHSHEDAAALLSQTKQITANQKVLTLVDQQAADQRQLAGVYQQWAGVVSMQEHALAHQLLLDAVIVLVILLALLLLDRWAQHLLGIAKLDRRQAETLRTIIGVGLRVLAAVIILLILVGMPNQFGTMIGIVGAGLTVALKDFIVAFFGWLVLMGRNGIRLGDWVEINGVGGEVTELGIFHTVLLETGNWSDAGHPTGRRVTFTNSFAIEGHYFNFSTSGQWLWDELHVVVPAGQDPYPIVEAISKQVAEATAENARLAEQEWRRAVPSQGAKTFSGTPGVDVKPVVGGVEIAVRYLTRAHERFQLRARLYQSAVDLLAQKTAARPAA
ncbi:MAG TPA: mechanosensitive ion channel domain-containing protein [Steroidobacteraceae bacterium]|nr:mechanosensitive ion channel domain-containing protein [Steroidobacteraceae bacterium]